MPLKIITIIIEKITNFEDPRNVFVLVFGLNFVCECSKNFTSVSILVGIQILCQTDVKHIIFALGCERK